MELPVIVHELRTLNEEYKKRLTDKEPATAVYCNGFCSILQKFLDKHNGSYEEYVFSLCIFLCHYAASYGELAIDNAKEKICQQLFRLCIKAVLDVKWKELSEDNTCRQKFRETVDAVHTQLERFDFYQFQLIRTLMETHWDHPTLSRIMAGADDLEEEEVMEYFAEEDPIVLKVRVEMLLDENLEEFALNLCKWSCLHPALIDNVEIRETQLYMLYSTGNVDKMQEECAKIPSEMAVQIIKNLQECEAQQSFCVMIAQTFLVQNWVRGLSADSGTKTLLKLWIRLQYLVDGDLDKFSDSIWAIAKLSQHTEQITFLVESLREEAGDTFLQLNTNLCIYAFNLDKGCLEQAVADKDMELILCRNVALSKTSQMIMNLYHGLCPKLAKLSAITAFALDPSEENFEIVYTIFHSTNQGSSSNSIASQHEDNLLDSNSPNKFVNKLTNMLDSLHMSPTKETKRLRPKPKPERNRHSMSHRTVDNVEFCGLSVNPATLYEVERLLNNICPFTLDVEINFTDLRNICMEHLTRHQEMLMILHEESTDECSEYSSFEDEQADRAHLSELTDSADTATELALDVDNSPPKLDACVVTECVQEVGDTKCMCCPMLDVIGRKSCPSSCQASNMKCNTTKTACHSNQACPNSVSSRNLFDAFNRDLSSKACSSQQEEQCRMTVDTDKAPVDKEVGYCPNISEKSARFPSCGASPSGNCKCDKSLSVHTCLSFDSQIDFANMMDNAPTPSAAHNLHSIEKSSSSCTSKLHKIRDEHCCYSSLPNTGTDSNALPVPTTPLKCMCKMKGKSSKKSDKSSLKCDKKLQQVPESNNKESQSKSSSKSSEDSTTNEKLLEKLRSCISAQTGSDSSNVDEKFSLSKMEKSYIDRYCQFLKTVRQFEVTMLTQKNCKPATKPKRNYLVVYRCGICCEFFDQVNDLKDHIQSICKAAVMDMKNLTEAASIFCTKDSVLSKIKFFKCLKCLQYTCTRREMDDHLRLCGVPLAKKSSKPADITNPVQKIELHKPSVVISGNPMTSTDSLQMNENNNNNVSLVKTENDPISEGLPSMSDPSKRLVDDEEGMSAEMACKKLDTPTIEMHSQVKCTEENVDKNLKPKSTNEEYFKCQMCGRLLLGPHRHRLHLEACKKRCEWRKDRRLKRMSLAKPLEKARPVIKKETPITSPITTIVTTTTTTTTTTTASTATGMEELPFCAANKMSVSTSKENLSDTSVHSNVDDIKTEMKPRSPLPQAEKPKHCPDCERIIKLRKVSQQLGISEKMLIKTEPQETSNRQTPHVLPMCSKQSSGESHLMMSELEADAAAVAATAEIVAAAAADVQIESATATQIVDDKMSMAAALQNECTNAQIVGDKMNTDECIKRTMLQIKSEMENKQLMEQKAESHLRRVSNSVSNSAPANPVSATDVTSKNKSSLNSDCTVSNPSPNSELAKCNVGSIVTGRSRRRSVGIASPYCRKCDFHFCNRSNFVKHLAITHLQTYTKEKIPNPDSNTVIFHCNFCQGAFQIWFKYINHIPSHSDLILERLNCKLVEETYTNANDKPVTFCIDPTDSTYKHISVNHSKSPLKKTRLKLVYPSPEEDIGTCFKRKRRRTYKSRRTNRHTVPHPNPSLGNLSKTTIMNFTQASSDADDNAKKEILQVMNDLLQKIVGTNEQGQNIMDVGSMPKSVTEKRKPISLPVHSVSSSSSSCPHSIPISDVTTSGTVTFPKCTVGQSCSKGTAGFNAKIPTSALPKETAPVVLEKGGIKTQQKGAISCAATSHFCPLQKKNKTILEGGKMSTISVSPHSSKNSGSIQSCRKPMNILQKKENVCSFNKVDASLKNSIPKSSFESCSTNVCNQDKDRSSIKHLPSQDRRKDGCCNFKKPCNVKLESSEHKCSVKNKTVVTLVGQQVDSVKKNDFSGTTTKTGPTLCKSSFLHSSCVSPSVSATSSTFSSENTSTSLHSLDPTSIAKKPTCSTCVSSTLSATPLPVSSVPTISASNSGSLYTSSSARTNLSDTSSVSMCKHISRPVMNASTDISCSSLSPCTSANDSSSSSLTKSSVPSISSFVTLQSSTSFAQTITETSVSSSLTLNPNSTSSTTTTNVLPSVSANSVPPYSICASTTNPPSKTTCTAAPIQMHQNVTSGPNPSTPVTITNSLSTIRDPVSTSNTNPIVCVSSGTGNVVSVILTPPGTATNFSTISVSSVKAPILSTSSTLKSANISVASSTSNVALTNLYSTENKIEEFSSKSIPSEADISVSLKPKTPSANINKKTGSQLNVSSSTTVNVSSTETKRQATSANLTPSTIEMCNDVIASDVEKATSTLNTIISPEAVSSLKTTATTKSAELNPKSETVSSVGPTMQSNLGPVSLQSSTVPNMVSVQPCDVTKMQSTTKSSLETLTKSSAVTSTAVPTQSPNISDSDNHSVKNLPLPSAIKSNAATLVSTSSTSVGKVPSSNVSPKTASTSTSKVPASKVVSQSSTSTSTLSNNSTGSVCITSTTSFQVASGNTSVKTSSSKDPPTLGIVSSIVTVPANTSTTTSVSKAASNVSTSNIFVTSEKAAAISSSITTTATSKVNTSSTSTATSKVNTSSTSTMAASKSAANVSVNKAGSAVSMATSAVLVDTTVTPKTSSSIATSIVSTAASKSITTDSVAKASVSTLKVNPTVTSSNATSTVSKGATTVALSETSTAVSSTMVSKIITSTVSACITTSETSRCTSTVSKSAISNTVSKTSSTVLPITPSTAAPTSLTSVNTTVASVSKSPTINVSESCKGLSIGCSELTKSTSNPPVKSVQGNCAAFSCTTTVPKASAPHSKESIVATCTTVSTAGTTSAVSTAAFNSSSSSSPCTFTTASSLAMSLSTCVTSSASASTPAIKQSMSKSDNGQTIAPEMPKLTLTNISPQIETPVQPLLKKTSTIESASVHCSSKDSLTESKDDCASEVEKMNTKPLKEDSQDCGMPNNDKVSEPDIPCQSKTSLHCSQTGIQLNNEALSSNSEGTLKCEIDSNNMDSSSFCSKSSTIVNCTTSVSESSSCNKRTETGSCDVKLSSAYENMSCNLMNVTCKEDEPVSSSEDCKFGCNEKRAENCTKESCFNEVKVKCKDVVENLSDGCLSSLDEIKEDITCKGGPPSPRGNENIGQLSNEDLNEKSNSEPNFCIDEKIAESEEEEDSMLERQISTIESDEQCKEQWPHEVSSEALSEVDESAKGSDEEKVHSPHTRQSRRGRGRPRKTNTELLLSSVASRQKLLNPGNIINFRLRKDRPTLKTVKCSYCCCKKRCQMSCVQNKCKSCIAEGTPVCRCNLTESQLSSMQKVALSNSTMCLNCHSNNKRASRANKRKRSPSPKPIRRRSNLHTPLRSSSVSNTKSPGNTRLQKISNVPFKKKLANSPRKNLVGSPHKKSLTSSSHKKMSGVNLKKLSSEYRKQKRFSLPSSKNHTEEFPKESSIISLKSQSSSSSSSSDALQDRKNVSKLATRRTLRSRKSLDETTPVIRQLRRSKSEQKLDSCIGDISKKEIDLLSVDNTNGTLINSTLPPNFSLENKTNISSSCCHSEEECCKVCSENLDKKFVGNRALKELRQRVKLGPFKWDLEESETGGRAHSVVEDDECIDSTDITTTISGSNVVTSKDMKASTLASLHTSHLSMPSPSASSPSFSSSPPSATADDELLGTGVTPPIRTYSRTQSPPSRIRVGRTYSKASDYQALPPGVMPVMPIIDCLRPTSHSSASHLCDMPRVHVVRVDKKGNMFETREPYPLPRNPLDLDMSRNVVDDEKGGGHRWKLQRTKMKTDGYPFSFKKTRIQ